MGIAVPVSSRHCIERAGRWSRRCRTIAVSLVTALTVTVPLAHSVNAATVDGPADPLAIEQDFVARLNQVRAGLGIGPLEVDAQLVSVARDWAGHLAAVDTLSHNPNLATDVTEPWVKLGENVGTGPSVDSLFSAFLASPHHYENIADPAFNRVGVGVVLTADGTIFTAHEFMQLPTTPPPTNKPAVATPAPAAAPARRPSPPASRPVSAAVPPAPRPAALHAAPVATARTASPAATAVLDHVVQSMEQLRSFQR